MMVPDQRICYPAKLHIVWQIDFRYRLSSIIIIMIIIMLTENGVSSANAFPGLCA